MYKVTVFLKIFAWAVLVACTLLLVKNILFKKSPAFYKNHFSIDISEKGIRNRWKKANKRPFATIGLFYKSQRLNVAYKLNNIAGNIIGFIPLGIFLPYLFRRLRKLWKTFFIVFFISLGFELSQLLFGLGVFDVDDLLLNSFGGILGFFLFLLIHKFWRSYRQQLTAANNGG